MSGDESPLTLPRRTDSTVSTVIAAWRRLSSPRRPSGRLGAGRPTIIACSGGADSSALAIALAASGDRFTLAHVVHDLRPHEQAIADSAAVRRLASLLQFDFVEAKVQTREFSGNREAVARELRYAALTEIARRRSTRFIAVAHTGTDQLETMLMRLIRGGGPRGLAGMPESRRLLPTKNRSRLPAVDDIVMQRAIEIADASMAGSSSAEVPVWLIRPMLALSREESERICTAAGWQWRVDATNTDVSRLRAGVRHTLLPAIRALTPDAPTSVEHRALWTSDLFRDAAAVIRRRAVHECDRASWSSLGHMRGHGPPSVTFRRKRLAHLTGVEIAETLRYAWGLIRRAASRDAEQGLDAITHHMLDAIIRAINDRGTDPRQFVLPGVSVQVTAHLLEMKALPSETVSHVTDDRIQSEVPLRTEGHPSMPSSNTTHPKVLLVGHCVPDSAMLTSMLRTACGNAVEPVVVRVNDDSSLTREVTEASLLLVNRVLDGEFGSTDGIALIARFASARAVPGASALIPALMLVSNYPEAQAAAVKVGARPGFGKAEAYAATTREKIAAALSNRDRATQSRDS
jgi:tRNA(Ile)-lysidine synthetase-like protein